MSKFGTPGYMRKLIKLEKKLQQGKLPEVVIHKANGYQGKMKNWIGVAELPDNHVNDKRAYYRSEYLKSEHWANLRAAKLKMNPLCERCGTRKRVEPHHKEYRELYNVELTDLVTLCRKCHTEEHKLNKVIKT